MKKILFNDKYGLTKAVLERRKTQTRRLVPKDFFTLAWDKREDTLVYENEEGDFIDIRDSKYALYKVGEVVAISQRYNDIFEEQYGENFELLDLYMSAGWDNKMFVKASKMLHHIRIIDVRIERLQDISDEYCLKEGIKKNLRCGKYGFDSNIGYISQYPFPNPCEAFAVLIDKVSGKGTWDSNPYVFVYDFELID
jgi:hypothetical protein